MNARKKILLFLELGSIALLIGCQCDEAAPASPLATATPVTQVTITPIPTGWLAAAEAALFSDEPCAPPCWQGITPGVSTEEDVARVLGQIKGEGKIDSYYKSGTGSSYEVYFSIGQMTIRLADGQVRYISSTFHPYAGIRARRVIERFGEPEAVAPNYGMPENDRWSCDDWDDSLASYASGANGLVYPSQGVTFVVDTPAVGFICPQMFSFKFYYYQPRTLAEALDEDRSPVFGLNLTTSEALVEWHGYGQGY